MTAETMPFERTLKKAADDVAREAVELGERSLLVVAVTRARRIAVVYAGRTPSPYLV